ncbi:MAG: hypothetical protein HKN15_06270 [Xanthomonadales bacterium]|nr:hypothetical protein [Xanthomonadales bacterium]
MKKWLKRIGLGLLGLTVLVVTTIYIGGEIIINRTYEPEAQNLLTSSRPDVISEGERLAKIYGCSEGCHGKDMEGQVFFEQAFLAKIIAPNLTRAVEQYSTAELEAIVRQGIKPDGKSVLGMPSASFSYLTDNDLSSILAFISSSPKINHDPGESSFGLLARLGLLTGQYRPGAKEVESIQAGVNTSSSAGMGKGEYLAITACSECHGLQLEGDFGPNLAIAKAYDLEAFTALMRDGKSVGGNELDLMVLVSQKRFIHLTDHEIEALHGFLQSR